MPLRLEQRPLDSHSREFLAEAAEAKFDFHSLSAKAAGDERLKTAIDNAVMRQHIARQGSLAALPDSDALRTLAGQIKQHTLDNLDYYVEQVTKAVTEAGGKVHFAATAADARRIITAIATAGNCRLCVKAKSMTSEEVSLTPTLEHAGLEVVETDLGEFIVQISKDRPSHIVAPIVHKDKASIAKLFSEYFSTPYDDDPTALTMQARRHLREKFRHADLGITGGNLLIAETGHVCIVTNEGNGRLTTTVPKILVSLVGIEKLIPRLADLSVFLKLLARSSTGQAMTVYTSLFGGPRKAGEKDGPAEFHLVLLDNGRSEILKSEYREILRCIRCGACLNSCPVYRKIGGHAYGAVYPGPIGALLTPLFQGLERFKELPQASSLCGACYEACPVKINIPEHLIRMRRDIVSRKLIGFWECRVYRLWAKGLRSLFLYKWIARMQKWKLRKHTEDGFVTKMPKVASGWTQIRDLPAPARKTFHQLWRKRP